jgi:TonB-linked SusC/RagA family outer membrane protein
MIKKFTLIFSFFFLSSIAIMAQEVKGTVVDENNDPIPGVSIIIEGTTKGTVSDINGFYSLKTTEPSLVLVFNFVGYSDYRIEISFKDEKIKELNISLEPQAELLDEYVVIGYGTAKKREITGSISQVNSDAVMLTPSPSFETSLQGQAAGVQVTQGSGVAGSSSIVRVRGIASISAGGDPLYVVDGIPIIQDQFITGNSGAMNNNPLAAINPSDIESIEVLKDAQATGIYGARGANGVILVTTKRAKKNGLQVDFFTRVGTSQPTSKPNMVNSQQYLQLLQEAWENDGGVGQAPLPNGISWEDAQQTNTDWVDEVTRTGFKQLYSLGAKYRNKKIGIYANYTYDGNESFLVNNKYTRNSGRINFDYYATDKLIINASTSLSYGLNNRVDNGWSGGLGAAMSQALPIYPIYYSEDVLDDNGEVIHSKGDFWVPANNSQGANPLRQMSLKQWQSTELRSINNLRLNYSPIKNFNVALTGAYDFMLLKEDRYEPKELLGQSNGFANHTENVLNNYNISLVGDYNWKVNEENNLKFLLGWEYQYKHSDGESIDWRNDPTGYIQDNFEPQTGVDAINPIFKDEVSFLSSFARVNYNLKNKYYIDLTARVDGSSNFGSNYRYGFFPTVSAGWIVSDEDFWNVDFLSYFKIKGGWGITGNADIPPYSYLPLASYSAGNGYAGNEFIYPRQRANPDLKWETSNNIDAGLEIGLDDNRYLFELGYYLKKSSDVLLNVELPRSSGFDTYWNNVAKIDNWGLEFNFTGRFIVRENFSWTSVFNVAHNRNKITDIGYWSEDAVSGGTNDTRVVIGEPVGTNFLVRFYGVDPENGRPIYLDIDGNQTYDWDPKDRVPVGSVLPTVVGGWTNNIQWKNWSASLFINFSLGGNIYDSSSKRQLGVISPDWSMRTELFQRWTTPGQTDAVYPVLTRDVETYGSSTPWINTDLWLKKGDYMRFKNLAIAYTFPEVNLGKLKMTNFKITGSMTNFITFTNFEGLDPEIARDFENAVDRNMSQGITYLTSPQERTYNLSINVTF